MILSAHARRLVEQHLGTAEGVARSIRPAWWLRRDDIQASAYYGLVRAAQECWPGARFPRFARVWCRRQVYRDLQRRRWPAELSGDMMGANDDPADAVIAAEEREWLHENLPKLTPRQRDVIALRLHGHKIGEIARQLKISHEACSIHYAAGLKRLRMRRLD